MPPPRTSPPARTFTPIDGEVVRGHLAGDVGHVHLVAVVDPGADHDGALLIVEREEPADTRTVHADIFVHQTLSTAGRTHQIDPRFDTIFEFPLGLKSPSVPQKADSHRLASVCVAMAACPGPGSARSPINRSNAREATRTHHVSGRNEVTLPTTPHDVLHRATSVTWDYFTRCRRRRWCGSCRPAPSARGRRSGSLRAAARSATSPSPPPCNRKRTHILWTYEETRTAAPTPKKTAAIPSSIFWPGLKIK